MHDLMARLAAWEAASWLPILTMIAALGWIAYLLWQIAHEED
jgi:hypothetical protein